MTLQNPPENQDGPEFPIFTEFPLHVTSPDGQRILATASLTDILNALKPANATMGHAIGVLLQYCDAPLEPEPISLVIELLRAAIGRETPEPGPQMHPEAARQAAFSLLPKDDQFYVAYIGTGQWVAVPLNESKTQSECSVQWAPTLPTDIVGGAWALTFHEDSVCVCEKTFKGDEVWAKDKASRLAAQLNKSRVTPPEIDSLSDRLKQKPQLLEFIEWKNCHAEADTASGCAQPDLESVPRTEEGGGTEETDRGAYPINDPHSGRISANDY